MLDLVLRRRDPMNSASCMSALHIKRVSRVLGQEAIAREMDPSLCFLLLFVCLLENKNED